MTTTAYLDLFIRIVSEPALLRTFLSFIFLHRHDNVHILDTLVSRINTPFQVPTYTAHILKIYSLKNSCNMLRNIAFDTK